MVQSAKRAYQFPGRAAMYSMGTPSRRAVGWRWFAIVGGTPLSMSKPIVDRYLSFAEREAIALLCIQDIGLREIARSNRCSPSTVSRDLTRNAGM